MRLSETITIYLAVGAPFGVNYFLRAESTKGQGRARTLLRATIAGLLWPFVVAADFLTQRSSNAASSSSNAGRESSFEERMGQKIAATGQQLFATLDRVRELARKTSGNNEELELGTRAVRAAIEKYTGLTLALAEVDFDGPPASQELELCRVAGRTGDDLLLAGRCIHRRNVARLISHQARSRTELLHALASVREISAGAHSPSQSEAETARQLSVAVLRFYGQAVNLLTLLEDESAATSAARLLDAECARLRSVEATALDADALPFNASSRAVV